MIPVGFVARLCYDLSMTMNETTAREIALEGMIEVLLDDNEDMTYEEAYALVDGSDDLRDEIAEIMANND